MSKHTPGPWEAESPEEECEYPICDLTEGWRVVALEADPSKYKPEADARLIAKAPELLVALEMLVEVCEQKGVDCRCSRSLVDAAKGDQ